MTTTRTCTMAIKTKFKMPKEGNQVKVTFTSGKAKETKMVYCVLDTKGEIDVVKTEARIEWLAENAIHLPVEEVVTEEVIEEVIVEEVAEEECCDDVCEDCE